MVEVIARVIGILSSPFGVFLLVMASLAAAGALIWAFWKRNDLPTTGVLERKPTQVIAPPLLAPSISTGGAAAVEPKDYTLRNLILGLVGMAVVLVGVRFALSGDASDDQFANNETNAPVQEAAVLVDPATPPAVPAYAQENLQPILCDSGPDSYDFPQAYNICMDYQAARVDVINIKHARYPSTDVSWRHGSGSDLSVDFSAPFFALSRDHADMRLGSQAQNLGDYDAFVAFGMELDEHCSVNPTDANPIARPCDVLELADLRDGENNRRLVTASVDAETAHRVSAERGFAMGRYVLEELRGDPEVDGDCIDSTVYAYSLGRYADEARDLVAARPVLLGVKFDERYRFDRRDMDGLMDAFVRSVADEDLTGMDLRDFEAPQLLFEESSCIRRG